MCVFVFVVRPPPQVSRCKEDPHDLIMLLRQSQRNTSVVSWWDHITWLGGKRESLLVIFNDLFWRGNKYGNFGNQNRD